MNAGEGDNTLVPRRAVVVPRVVAWEGGEALPLEYHIGRLLEKNSKAAVCLVGEAGSGKTTALQHLAAVFGAALMLVDGTPQFPFGQKLLVFASRTRPAGPVVYEMSDWTRDEVIEYLLHAHRAECRSVMERVEGHGIELPGNAALCVAVIEELTRDVHLVDISEAFRRAARREAGTVERYQDAMGSCAAAVLRGGEWYGLAPDFQEQMLQHRTVAEALAAEKLAREIATLHLASFKESWTDRLRILTARVLETLPFDWQAFEHAVLGFPTYHADAASLLLLIDPKWRPGAGTFSDLAGAMLEEARWQDIDLSGYRLTDCDFSQADLTRANLRRVHAGTAKFRRTQAPRVCLAEAKLDGADFFHADMTLADLGGASLEKANMEGADLHGADLTLANLAFANMKDAILVGAILERASLEHAVVELANFQGANFRGALLGQVDLRRAGLEGADFTGSRLPSCNLSALRLENACFEGADLYRSDLTETVLRGANLQRANLREAGLAGVDWMGADLRDADFTYASFHMGSSRSGLVGSVIASEGSRTGFYTDDFTEQYYKNPEEIRKANLCGCDLRGAIVEETDWYLVDLRGAEYTTEQGVHFLKCGAILRERDESR